MDQQNGVVGVLGFHGLFQYPLSEGGRQLCTLLGDREMLCYYACGEVQSIEIWCNTLLRGHTMAIGKD